MGKAKAPGKQLEMELDRTHKHYNAYGLALVARQNPELTITSRNARGQIQGFTKEKGAPDYIGVTHGRAFTFDAKETKETTRFPLDNIKPHQMEFMRKFRDQGGYAFFIVRFVNRGETFILPYTLVETYWQGYLSDGAKSIPYGVFNVECERVEASQHVTTNYINHVWKVVL